MTESRLDSQSPYVRSQRSTPSSRRLSEASKRADPGPLQALEQIETVGDTRPFRIQLVRQLSGSAMPLTEVMAARVRWANTVHYMVLTRDVPSEYAPYNAIIRVIQTEDYRTDYLATLID